jgi:hypothetical protein
LITSPRRLRRHPLKGATPAARQSRFGGVRWVQDISFLGAPVMATQKSILNESRDIERAISLINLGARLQVLEYETSLSYERLLRLYKEVAGKSPSKGQLPFSTDWFLTWQPNIHASLFLNIHEYLSKTS